MMQEELQTNRLTFHLSYKKVTSKEMNEHLKFLKEHYYIIRFISYEDAINYGFNTDNYFYAYLKINFVNITLTFKRNFKWENYQHNLSDEDDDENIIQPTDPASCYASLQKVCHFPSLEGQYGYNVFDNKVGWCIPNLGGLRYANEKFVNTRNSGCICYDRNSAFDYACVDLVLPNTNVQGRKWSKPKDGEIGFNSDGEPIVGASDILCVVVFPAYIDENLTKWAKLKYKQKKNAKTKQEKQKYKNHINYAIGCLARHNPFIRNCIIYKSNQLMDALIDENTLMSNTDSIVSLKPRKDLKIGEDLGDFKIEHEGDFALSETGYQWDYELPSICGFVKRKAEMFEKIVGRKYDILKDGILENMVLPRYIDIKELVIYNNDVDNEICSIIRRKYGI